VVGTTLQHYQIMRLLGRGGMGDVYAAKDTKLNRTVALKLLPPATSDDPERLKRFRREAQAIAALNHPNVVTIYAVEDAGGTPFLTMELVEGKSLDAVIPRRGMAVGALLDVALPLTDAVAAAHQHGIVHRDLKPSNVMIGADGRVKVLDFGLAKLKQEAAGDPTAAATATIEQLTARHHVIGTAAYMSPEQAEGRFVDHRSDIFSLGVLLFEMATGARPFTGGSAMSILSSIIKDTPAPATTINPQVPPDLDRIIRRCLAKDPSRRYQSALDVRNELEELRQQSPAARSRFGRRFAAAGRVIAVVTLAAAALVLWRQRGDRPTVTGFRKLTSAPGREWFPSLSPDGKWLVYSGEGDGNLDIYFQSAVPGSVPVNLTRDSPADDDMPAFSPDGDHIAFRSGRDGGGIFVMGRTGEALRRVTRGGYNPAWSPDGSQIAFTSGWMTVNPQNSEGRSEIFVVSASGGEPKRLTEPGADDLQPSWSPHQRRIAMFRRGAAGGRRTDIWTIPVGGGPAARVTDDAAIDWNPIWSPDGRYLYYSSDRGGTMNLWRVALDETSGRPSGEPEAITTPAPFFAHPTTAADGKHLAYSSVLMTTNIQGIRFDPVRAAVEGEPFWVTSGSRLWSSPDPSPNGEHVVFYSRVEPEGHLYVSRTDGTGIRQLTGDKALDRVPRWSPDGNWISFFSNRTGMVQIWKIRSDASDLTQVTNASDGGAYSAWSPDGSRLAVAAIEGQSRTVYIIDPNRPWDQQQPEKLPPHPEGKVFNPTSWTADGARLLGVVGQMSPGTGIVAYSFEKRSYERFTDFGAWPVPLPDSRRVLFSDDGPHYWLLDMQTREKKIVYAGGRDTLGPPRISKDGRAMFYSRRVTESDIWMMTLAGPR